MILILPIIPIVSELFSGEIRRADTPVVFRYKYTTSARRCQANRRKNFFGGGLGELGELGVLGKTGELKTGSGGCS